MSMLKKDIKSFKAAVDENILIKDEICSAGSKMLYNFKSPYSATVIDKITEAGITISCQTKIGEFGDEIDQDNAASSIKRKIADIAFGIDVDGSAYRAAVRENVIYVKPTYGTVSRFGVVANVSSVDQIGVYADNPDDGFRALSVIAGYDKNDGTSYKNEKYDYNADNINLNNLKIAKLNNFFDGTENSLTEKLEKLNIPVESINFELSEYLSQVYFIISSAEFSNNISRFDGLKFGYRTEKFSNVNDMTINSRSESFGIKTKIKSLAGTYVLSEEQYEKYYLKSMQIRKIIKQKVNDIFNNYDFIILPVMSSSYKYGDNTPEAYFGNLKFSALANLTGCPSVSMNIDTGNDKNCGIQILAKEFDENTLLQLSKKLFEL